VPIEAGDTILLFSDGALGAGAPDNKLGQDGLERSLLGFEGPVTDLPDGILAEVEQREPGAPQDDITIVALCADPWAVDDQEFLPRLDFWSAGGIESEGGCCQVSLTSRWRPPASEGVEAQENPGTPDDR
jgi:hypothetical protein